MLSHLLFTTQIQLLTRPSTGSHQKLPFASSFVSGWALPETSSK